MILSEYDRERHMRQVYEEGRAEGERLGREEGERLGREEGERLGREEGERLGREEGERLGREEGERLGREEGERLGREKVFKKALQLLQPLLANGQIEDLEKAVNDPEFQKKLLEEFDIL